MSFSLPDGSKFFISTGVAAALTVSGLSNANPAVATSTAHGLLAGDEILLYSGWEDANESVFRVASPAANTFAVSGLDTTDTQWFPAGTGTGTAAKISGWQEIQQLTNVAASGGDAQFATVELLSRRNAIQIPTRFNATSLTLTMADDPNLAGYQALQSASRGLKQRAFKLLLAGGGTAYGFGYVALNEMPQLNKGQVNTVTASLSLTGRFIRYSS